MKNGVMVSGEELAALLLEPNIADVGDVPCWVAVDARDQLPERLTSWVRQQPVPVIGVGGEHAAFDVLAPDEGSLASIAAAIETNPVASAVLVQVLRSACTLDIPQALQLESLAYGVLQGGAEHARWLARQPQRSLASAEDVVRLERVGDALQVTLTHPARRNALSTSMRDGLTEAFKLAAVDETIRVVEVRAEGPCFCAGGDLAEFGTTRDTARAHALRQARMPAQYLALCAHKCTTYLHGACIGAGIELPAFAHRVVARSDSTFRLPEVAMGLIPGAGGCVSIPRRIGRQRTAELAITGRTLDAGEAFRIGLVDQIVGAAEQAR